MAEPRKVRIPSESPVALIIFIVTTVLLLVACYFLYAALASRQTTLDEIQNGLQREVLTALEKAKVDPKLDNSPAAPTPYGDDFFALLGKTVGWGLSYQSLTDLCGFPPATAPSDMAALLKEVAGTSSITVRDLIKSLKDKIDNQQKALDAAAETEKKLQAQIQSEQEAKQKAVSEKNAEIEKLTKQVADKDKEMESLRAEMKAKLDAAQEEVSKAQKEYSDKKAALDQERAAFVAKVDAALKELRDRLAKMNRRVPERIEVPDTENPIKQRMQQFAEMVAIALQPTVVAAQAQEVEGRVLNVNPALRTAYINLGARDGVKTGMLYTVFEIGKAGKRIEKGEVEVVKVDEAASTVGILKQLDRLNPIVPGDIVVKKPPEVVVAKVKAPPRPLPPPPPPKPKVKEEKEEEKETTEEKKEAKEEKEETKEEKEEGKKEAKEEKAEEEKKEKKEEGKKEEEGKEEKKAGGGNVMQMMMQLGAAGKAIQTAVGAKDIDTIKAKADEIAEVAKMAMSGPGMNEEMMGMYKMMGESAAALSAAAAKKDEAAMMEAMKKVASSCTACHAKYKK